jgi:hypothetical protein
MTIARWIACGVTGILFLLLAAFNAWSMVAQRTKPGQPHVSPAPLVGGIIGLVAVLIAPVGSIGHRLPFAAMPLFLDLGCGLYFGAFVFEMIKERKRPANNTPEGIRRPADGSPKPSV